MRKMTLVFFILFFAFPVSSLAGEYVLVDGKGREVCEAYGKNLNSFALHSPIPMICERKINPESNDFQHPKWEEIDLWEYRELLRRIERFLGDAGAYGDSEKWPHLWEEQLKWRIEHKFITVLLTNVDIDNDGKIEHVIKYINGHCPESRSFGTPILVINDKRDAIDIDKSKHLLQNPKFVGTSLSEGWDLAMYDVFLYKGKIYFDRWSQSYDQRGYLRVFLTELENSVNPLTKEICRYQYKNMK